MNQTLPRFVRLGAVLSVVAALLAFLVRSSSAQAPRNLSLGDAARLAASQTYGVQSANFRVQEAQSRVTQQKSALYPEIDASPNWSSRTVNSATFGFNLPPAVPGQKPILNPDGQILGPVRIWDFRGNLNQSIWDPTTNQRVKAAKSSVFAASADVATAAEQSANTAANGYVRAIRSDAALQARIADSTLAVDLLTIARDQLAAGVGVALDVTRAESQLATSRAQLISARNDRDRSRLDLLRALNLPLDAPISLSDSLVTMPLPAPENEQAAVDKALHERPDILATTAQIDVALQQLAVIKSGRLPKVSAFGNEGYDGFINHLLNTYTYGVGLSWSVYDGKRRSAQEQEQQAMARDLDARRRDLQQQVAVDVRGAILDMASAREQVDAARERQRLAEKEVQEARDRFRAGVAGNADVITASLTLNNARTSLVDALASFQSARVALARAEGVVTQLK
jgi:outer membrane protein TolC